MSVERTVPRQILPINSILLRFKFSSIKLTADLYIIMLIMVDFCKILIIDSLDNRGAFFVTHTVSPYCLTEGSQDRIKCASMLQLNVT